MLIKKRTIPAETGNETPFNFANYHLRNRWQLIFIYELIFLARLIQSLAGKLSSYTKMSCRWFLR